MTMTTMTRGQMNPILSQRMRLTRRLPLFTLLASLLVIGNSIVVVFAQVTTTTTTATTTTEANAVESANDDDPSCFSLSTSEKDCLLTITSNLCEWVYDDTGNALCQEVTSTTTTSTILSTYLPENYQYTRPPRNEIRYTPWNELSRELQVLATGSLRYTKSTWDNLGTNSIEQLRYDDLSAEQMEVAKALGFEDDISWNCWQNHWESFSWAQLYSLQLTPYLNSIGWTSSGWNEQYTNPPITRKSSWLELSVEQRLNATELCFDRTSYDRLDLVSYGTGYPIAIPSLRFTPWKEIIDDNNATRLELLQQTLGYDELTWNVLRLAAVEQKGWHELTPNESNAVEDVFGLDDAGWDCWMNHYDSYSWSDLMNSGIDAHFIGLGWSESSWEDVEGEVDPPESEGKLWDKLNEVEQYHATELCYTQENWDRIDMTSNHGPFPYPKPKLRYTVWKDLPSEKQQVAQSDMLYDKRTWDDTGLADIERRSWEDLTDYQKAVAIYLGMYQRTWDCFQNHYRATLWDELPLNVSHAAIKLGWDEYLWSGSSSNPEAYGRRWDQLREEEQSAATVMCYFNVSWPGDGTTINLWDQYNDAYKQSVSGMVLSSVFALSVLMMSR